MLLQTGNFGSFAPSLHLIFTKLVTFQTIVQPLRLPSRRFLPYQYHQAVQLLNKDSESKSGGWYPKKEVESESWKENGLELENFSWSHQKSVSILKTGEDQMMIWTRNASIKVAKWGIPMFAALTYLLKAFVPKIGEWTPQTIFCFDVNVPNWSKSNWWCVAHWRRESMRDKTSPSSFKHQIEQNSLLLLYDDVADDFADENTAWYVGSDGKSKW